MEQGTDALLALVRAVVRSGLVGRRGGFRAAAEVPCCGMYRPRSATHAQQHRVAWGVRQREMGNRLAPDWARRRSRGICLWGRRGFVEPTVSSKQEKGAEGLGLRLLRKKPPVSWCREWPSSKPSAVAAITLDPCRGWGRNPLARICVQKEPVVSPVGSGAEYRSTRRVSWRLDLLLRQGARGPFEV